MVLGHQDWVRACERLLHASNNTASKMIAPLAISCQNAGTPRRSRALLITPINNAPINAPHGVPTPPNSDAPPITAAAIAFSSYNRPASGPPDRSCPTRSTPARPAHSPEMTYALSFTHGTGTPA